MRCNPRDRDASQVACSDATMAAIAFPTGDALFCRCVDARRGDGFDGCRLGRVEAEDAAMIVRCPAHLVHRASVWFWWRAESPMIGRVWRCASAMGGVEEGHGPAGVAG